MDVKGGLLIIRYDLLKKMFWREFNFCLRKYILSDIGIIFL